MDTTNCYETEFLKPNATIIESNDFSDEVYLCVSPLHGAGVVNREKDNETRTSKQKIQNAKDCCVVRPCVRGAADADVWRCIRPL